MMTGSSASRSRMSLQNLDAVALGQGEIEQHQVEGLLGDARQAFLAVVGGLDRVAFELQQSLQRLANRGFVVDDQHRCPAMRGLVACRARSPADGCFRH